MSFDVIRMERDAARLHNAAEAHCFEITRMRALGAQRNDVDLLARDAADASARAWALEKEIDQLFR